MGRDIQLSHMKKAIELECSPAIQTRVKINQDKITEIYTRKNCSPWLKTKLEIASVLCSGIHKRLINGDWLTIVTVGRPNYNFHSAIFP